MNIARALSRYQLNDSPILSHGFCQYMRDYALQVYLSDQNQPGLYEFVFEGCVEAHTSLTLAPEQFSMDDQLLDEQEANASTGRAFVWGQGFSSAQPGWRYLPDSTKARDWGERLGLAMHELVIETQVYSLSLIFHELQVRCLEPAMLTRCLAA